MAISRLFVVLRLKTLLSVGPGKDSGCGVQKGRPSRIGSGVFQDFDPDFALVRGQCGIARAGEPGACI